MATERYDARTNRGRRLRLGHTHLRLVLKENAGSLAVAHAVRNHLWYPTPCALASVHRYSPTHTDTSRS
eukprot:2191609-Rhodomonas_salina.2